MTAEQLIIDYGYWALLIGTFLEGETILLVAGFLAHQGLLDLHWVILAAFSGSFASDQTAFYIGRNGGMRLLARRPSWRDKTQRVFDLLYRHQLPIILGFRFVYGIRNVTPFAIGASGFPAHRFLVLNLFGALIWAISFAFIGYQTGAAIKPLFEFAKNYELAVVGLVLATVALFFLRSRRLAKSTSASDETIAEVSTPATSKLSLNSQIFLGALLGILLGMWFQLESGTIFSTSGLYLAGLIGGAFIDLLKLVLIPLIVTSIAVGIASLQAHRAMHRVWQCTVGYFLTATTLATLLGLFTANVFKPGAGLNMKLFHDATSHFDAQRLSLDQFFSQFFHNLFMNPMAAMAQGEILAVVVFAIMLGVALVVSGERSRHVRIQLAEWQELVMVMIGWIMKLAPIGICALLAKLAATQSLALFASLGKFVAVVLGGTLFHGFVTLPLLLYLVTRIGPGFFFRGAREALVTAFATSSSSATLPVTQQCTEFELGVEKNIARFVPPLGATLNMDGTALYEAAAALFVANLTGAELNLVQQAVVCFTAILASIGAPGIPSAGMVTMVMVLQSVGLPAEAIAILLPIDRVLDTVRTMVNVEGDMIGSLIVQKLAGESDPPSEDAEQQAIPDA
jgi:Na+/H+-dicarboxylate symporter/membrane protein DedA with SNARE-associated domain